MSEKLDELLSKAASEPPRLEASLVEKLKAPILSSLRPVRPLPRTSVLVCIFVAIAASFALAGALFSGMFGFRLLDTAARFIVFGVLGFTAALTAHAAVREMKPGSGATSAAPSLALTAASLLVAFLMVLRDYSTQAFVRRGIPCMRSGILLAIPAGLVVFIVLRRGYVLNWLMAGVAAGALAGLAGIGMLEMHCPNLSAPHVVVWHGGVLLLAGAAGWIAGILRRTSRT